MEIKNFQNHIFLDSVAVVHVHVLIKGYRNIFLTH